MNKRFALMFQIASLVVSASAVARVNAANKVEKGQHEGFLLDSKIKYAMVNGDVDAKVILNGDNWTLVARTPQGNTLYGRTEKVVAAAEAGSSDETIRILYREVNDAGAEVTASATTASVGSPASVDLKDAHIESLVSKIRYQID